MQKPKKTKNQLNQKKSPTIKLQPQAPQKGKLKSMAKKEKRFPWLVYFSAVIVLVLTLLCYSQVHKNGFTNWDDPGYVTESETIDKGLTWNNIKIIFSKPQVSNYHPLTILSLTIDYEISKKYFSLPDNKPVPTIFHLTNLIFHLLATLMVFIFIYHLTHKKLLISIIVSALFGIHPMHVESVAWISEKKDVLYGFFFVAALFTYVKYYKTKKILYFVLTFFLFILSILSKPAGIVFPFVLMLVDFSLNENIIIRNFKELYFSFINYFQNKCYLKSRTWEKIFLLFFALAELYITYKIQENKAVADFDTFTVWQRFMFASYGFIMYINKLFVPVKLTTFYPYPNLDEHGYIPLIFYVSPFIVLGFLVLIYLTMKRTKAAIWGIIFYFITVALVLQFISVGRAIMSDRYTYIPYIGLFFIIGYYYDFVIQLKTKYSLVLKLIFSLALVGWGIYLYTSAYERVKVWKTSETLWSDVIKNYPNVDVAYKNRGNYYGKELNQPERALKDYEVLIAMNTKEAEIYSNLGNIYGLMKKFDKSLDAYSKSIELNEKNLNSYINRGITYAMMNNYEKALEDFAFALKLSPNNLKVIENRAYVLLQYKRYDESIVDYNLLIQNYPDDTKFQFYRGLAFFNLEKYQEALNDFLANLNRNPQNAEAAYNASVTYSKLKNNIKALEFADKAKSLGFNVPENYYSEIMNSVK